jgi:hypothetical protein
MHSCKAVSRGGWAVLRPDDPATLFARLFCPLELLLLLPPGMLYPIVLACLVCAFFGCDIDAGAPRCEL